MRLQNSKSLTKSILHWYDRNARILPWRVTPSQRQGDSRIDPYEVWLSEIMLQQTTVAAVRQYFDKFVRLWPTVFDLAAVDESEVLKAWAGLGYYSRARNLKKCADIIVQEHGGVFPESERELQALPGIGPYTAAAIAAIAFDRRAVVVDGNVERVMARMFAIDEPLPGAKKVIRQHAASLTPDKRPGDYAQALMDLGATICTPRNPNCSACPWQSNCKAHSQKSQEAFPVKAPKIHKPHRFGLAFAAVRQDGAVLLRQRPPKGLLAAMSEIPGTEWKEEKSDYSQEELDRIAPIAADWRKARNIVKHTFTHFHLELEVWVAVAPTGAPAPPAHWWSSPDEISGEALPTVMRKAIATGLAELNSRNSNRQSAPAGSNH